MDDLGKFKSVSSRVPFMESFCAAYGKIRKAEGHVETVNKLAGILKSTSVQTGVLYKDLIESEIALNEEAFRSSLQSIEAHQMILVIRLASTTEIQQDPANRAVIHDQAVQMSKLRSDLAAAKSPQEREIIEMKMFKQRQVILDMKTELPVVVALKKFYRAENRERAEYKDNKRALAKMKAEVRELRSVAVVSDKGISTNLRLNEMLSTYATTSNSPRAGKILREVKIIDQFRSAFMESQAQRLVGQEIGGDYKKPQAKARKLFESYKKAREDREIYNLYGYNSKGERVK